MHAHVIEREFATIHIIPHDGYLPLYTGEARTSRLYTGNSPFIRIFKSESPNSTEFLSPFYTIFNQFS